MADTTSDKALKAKLAKGGVNAAQAAYKYVWNGMQGTGLSAKAQQDVANKLIPIVKSRIQNDLNKTATRGAIQKKREEINAKKKATNKIIGGK